MAGVSVAVRVETRFRHETVGGGRFLALQIGHSAFVSACNTKGSPVGRALRVTINKRH